jgi:hypothetical protein
VTEIVGSQSRQVGIAQSSGDELVPVAVLPPHPVIAGEYRGEGKLGILIWVRRRAVRRRRRNFIIRGYGSILKDPAREPAAPRGGVVMQRLASDYPGKIRQEWKK